ncbi:hypothetical protein GOD95_02600 [Paeniclostridium sordellii]|uniref:hypothetical protein n=1 Tax=Paraclostridium sordellii TaxID=1505 RepID=UPI0012EED85E|nr:hypothetical protein [Paeniclostridium sordellii]ELC8395046.1 hypothetical protein [Clostridium perfringens]MDK0735987.1 hypothetical protein [Clostridium perfringens]MVO70335.1 hypothetical protein [Paeniclostridium sordellii]
MKKKTLTGLLTLVLCSMTAIPAMAETVYYKGNAVNWEHGRKWAVYSFSEVQTSVYEHSATANSTFSGWKDPGDVAYAQQYVGTSTARAYWNCR